MERLTQRVRRFLESANTAQRVAALVGLVITVVVLLYAFLPFTVRAGGQETSCAPAPVSAVVGKIGATDSVGEPFQRVRELACRSGGRSRMSRSVLLLAVGLTVGMGGAVVLGPPTE